MTAEFQVTEEEALVIADSLAWHRYWKHCKCEDGTGFVCKFCSKRFHEGSKYDCDAVLLRYRDLLMARFVRSFRAL